MSHRNEKHAPYLRRALNTPRHVVETAVKALDPVEFDAIVCTGVSGLLVAPMIAMTMGKRLAVVRKPNDDGQSNHSEWKVECGLEPGDRWVFVDDLVASGRTVQRVQEAMLYVDFPHCVGRYVYNDEDFRRGMY